MVELHHGAVADLRQVEIFSNTLFTRWSGCQNQKEVGLTVKVKV